MVRIAFHCGSDKWSHGVGTLRGSACLSPSSFSESEWHLTHARIEVELKFLPGRVSEFLEDIITFYFMAVSILSVCLSVLMGTVPVWGQKRALLTLLELGASFVGLGTGPGSSARATSCPNEFFSWKGNACKRQKDPKLWSTEEHSVLWTWLQF